MPVKNAAAFLHECLDSIVHQTYQNWELLAIDDHSTDNSHHILLEYSFKDERISVLKNPGKGIIDALNSGFKQSHGDLICRMDADDIMINEKLAIMSGQLNVKGTGNLAVGLVEYFSEDALGNGYKIYEAWLNSLTYYGENFQEIYKECVIPSPCWMVFRKDFMRAGAFASEVYPEDYDLAFRFYQSGLKCIPCDTILHKWRDYQERTSRNSEHYKDNNFLDLKIKYFFEIDRDFSRPLVVWGAGKKGKALAKKMVKQEIDFFWVSNNQKKIGQNIYGRVIQDVFYAEALKKPQIIIMVSSPEDQSAIRAYLNAELLEAMEDYFFFC